MSPELAGRFFTTSPIWDGPFHLSPPKFILHSGCFLKLKSNHMLPFKICKSVIFFRINHLPNVTRDFLIKPLVNLSVFPSHIPNAFNEQCYLQFPKCAFACTVSFYLASFHEVFNSQLIQIYLPRNLQFLRTLKVLILWIPVVSSHWMPACPWICNHSKNRDIIWFISTFLVPTTESSTKWVQSSLSIHRGLVPGPSWTPKSIGAQGPHIKWHSVYT